MSEIHSFVGLSDIPLYVSATFCLFTIERHLSWFCLLAIVTAATLKSAVHLSVFAFIILGCVPRSGIAGSRNNSRLNLFFFFFAIQTQLYSCLSSPLQLLFFLFLNWRLITVPCCVRFCHTTMWISLGLTFWGNSVFNFPQRLYHIPIRNLRGFQFSTFLPTLCIFLIITILMGVKWSVRQNLVVLVCMCASFLKVSAEHVCCFASLLINFFLMFCL